mmetsp:Transcript_5522/g.20132  ORF Transcript_5522/g.20132 Transcript_5522/m.20132 type:complete len:430 (+) Transcript_5522:105-1394(+)
MVGRGSRRAKGSQTPASVAQVQGTMPEFDAPMKVDYSNFRSQPTTGVARPPEVNSAAQSLLSPGPSNPVTLGQLLSLPTYGAGLGLVQDRQQFPERQAKGVTDSSQLGHGLDVASSKAQTFYFPAVPDRRTDGPVSLAPFNFPQPLNFSGTQMGLDKVPIQASDPSGSSIFAPSSWLDTSPALNIGIETGLLRNSGLPYQQPKSIAASRRQYRLIKLRNMRGKLNPPPRKKSAIAMQLSNRYRLEHVRNGRSRKWTQEEDALVRSMVKEQGTGSWVKIANALGNKTPKQVHARYRDYLRPGIREEQWTNEELLKLTELHKVYGNSWSTLSKKMPGRSANSIKNMINSTRRKRSVRLPWPHSSKEGGDAVETGNAATDGQQVLWNYLHCTDLNLTPKNDKTPNNQEESGEDSLHEEAAPAFAGILAEAEG